MVNIKRFLTRKTVGVIVFLFVVAVIFGVYQVHTLNIAHSSLDNYAKFRGCASLPVKTDTYAMCTLASGQTIKLVQVNNKWFLDGDLGW